MLYDGFKTPPVLRSESVSKRKQQINLSEEQVMNSTLVGTNGGFSFASNLQRDVSMATDSK